MQQIIDDVIGAYPSIGTKPQYCIVNNAFGLYSNDGKRSVSHVTNNLCHKKLREVEPGFYDNLITSWPKDDKEFFLFLTNFLYRNWAQYIHRKTDPKTKKKYILVTDLDKIPANVLQNFCIASRMPVEFPHNIVRMKELMNEGLHPCFAFALRQAQTNPNGTVLIISSFQDHSPMSNTSSLRTLVSCEPVLLSVPFKEEPKKVTPTNCIWGESQDLRALQGLTIHEFWNNWKEKNADILHAL